MLSLCMSGNYPPPARLAGLVTSSTCQITGAGDGVATGEGAVMDERYSE